ncbi:MAG: LVIVD repeat-containing protein, partial [Planctomycetota bacterium]
EGNRFVQSSMVDPDRRWTIPQIKDGAARNPASWLAKTIQRDNETWGDPAGDLAHHNERMTCFSCHTSWVTSCYGCHLPMRANQKAPSRHYDGDLTRNFTPYNFQTLRTGTFMLGIDGDVTGNRVAPTRSACAVMVGSQNSSREWVYSQQQTISAEGFSGIAFATHVPHTVRKQETKTCTDCHLSREGDNNAIMTQLLMQGTGFMNFMYRWVYVGTEEGVEAVVVTERDEPQAVIGSTLHRDAYPDFHRQHLERGRRLPGGYRFNARHRSERANVLQLRGEYLYVADGPGGLRIFDVAQIDQKGFSERIVTAPVSPLDQRFSVASRDATCVASPTTLGVDPLRTRLPGNREQKIHLLYGFLYVTDREEGLITVLAATLLDGDPRNNTLERAVTFNPDGILDGARHIALAGRYGYVCCDRGVVVIDFDDPLKPRVAAVIEGIRGPSAVAVQFRYAFVAARDTLVAVDVTPEPDGSFPRRPRIVSRLAIPGARELYLARTYAYLAAGKNGLAIVDITRPGKMRLDRTFDAGGEINDCRDVQVGITNASLFAYLADGRNGLRVVQLTSPEAIPGIEGFSPRPEPQLIATFQTRAPALSISRGLDRDRGVDEAGNQLSVFNRVGSRPFTFAEMKRLYRLPDGKLFTVPEIRSAADVAREYPTKRAR